MKGKIIKGIAGFYYVHVMERASMNARPRESFGTGRSNPL